MNMSLFSHRDTCVIYFVVESYLGDRKKGQSRVYVLQWTVETANWQTSD